MSQSFELDEVDLFTVAAIGEPGRRVFLLQAVQGRQVMTLKVEKQQVAALASYIGELIAEAPRPGHLPEDLALQQPAEVDWVAGTIGAAYDEVADRIVLSIDEAEFGETDELDSLTAGNARISVTREQAAAMAIRGAALVEAGRPPCPLCGHPLDPSGHACPRTNGNRPPTP